MRAMDTRESWRSFFPTSAKPPEMTTAPPAPAWMQSAIMSGTVSARVAITARSIFFGISEIRRYTFSPWYSSPFFVYRKDLHLLAEVVLVENDVGRVSVVGQGDPDDRHGPGFEHGLQVHGKPLESIFNLFVDVPKRKFPWQGVSPKFEARNPKSEKIPNKLNPELSFMFNVFEPLNFEFVSNFSIPQTLGSWLCPCRRMKYRSHHSAFHVKIIVTKRPRESGSGSFRLHELWGAAGRIIIPGRSILEDESKRPRSSGVLLHISSLPSLYGFGDLGPSAYQFADFWPRPEQELVGRFSP